MRRVPVQTGVTMFSCHSSGNGDDQSVAPVRASRPTTDELVIVTICGVPAMSITIGDA